MNAEEKLLIEMLRILACYPRRVQLRVVRTLLVWFESAAPEVEGVARRVEDDDDVALEPIDMGE